MFKALSKTVKNTVNLTIELINKLNLIISCVVKIFSKIIIRGNKIMGQREEIETIKARNISLNLSDADVKRLCEKAGSVGLAVSELLESFIGDLVDGTYTNGSDERMYANEWFERCGFSWMSESFLRFLIDCDDVEDTVDDWNEIKYYKDLEELGEDDKEDLAYYEESINDKFEEYRRYKKADEEKLTLEAEMEKVVNWWNEYEQIKGDA